MVLAHRRESTAGEVILRSLRRHAGSKTAFTWGEGDSKDRGSLSYGQALDAIGRTQAVLADAGLGPGSRIGILSGNRVDSWLTATAAWCSGLVVTYLHPIGSLADHLYQLSDARVEALFVDPAKFAERGATLAEQANLKHLYTFGSAEVGRDLHAAREQVGSHAPVDVADPDDLVWLNYTGGTTGRPKGVRYRHASVLGHSRSVLTDFELPADPRYLAAAPITHVAGTKILPVLLRGGSVHLLDGFTASGALRAIEEQRLTMALFVPTMIYTLLDDPALDSTDLSSLELVLYGASAMSPSRLAEGHERLGDVFAQLYGQSECYPISYLSRADHTRGREELPALLSSCGFPVHGTSVALLDSDGTPVPRGEAGEICVRGQAAMEGYHDLPALTEEALAGGWLHTGDIGTLDDSGFLTIVDRKKDMIVTGGFNVFPREVEDALTSHPDVATAAVYGVPDEKWGEAVTAAVVLKPGATVDEATLVARVKELKGSVQAPKHVHVLTELPMTAVGKIDKKQLRQQH
ncbi:AMP-binding protein [Nocardioides campestrisoli]|uniref:AMP-binding protein n=1 Tax=Nocardioides campestrisoli TaxID=2736757 RepID=UPI00163DD8B1|nr:AMP-binding protein [Nocardioides campestrisoli]